jgi:Flp pilus assembly protein TadG
MMKFNPRGQSLAEFALTLPLLLLVVMGIFDLGRGIYFYSAVHNAAREGARYGAIDHCNTTAIQNAAREVAGGIGNSLIVDIPTKIYSPDGYPERIVVTVRYNFQTVTPLIGRFFSANGSIMLVSQARQLIEIRESCP